MGVRDAARVDLAALLEVARGFDDLADDVDDVARTHMTALSFDGAVAGRSYVARGDALRRSIDRVGDGMRLWSRACVEIASALRASAVRYGETDVRGARRLG
jgi:hypothetical protein